MAITTDDFNKIWASASPLTPYSFSESQYKEGWNFIGSTPPSRQMWDFLQKNNDEKSQYLLNNFDNYLPLSGGTLTGVVNGVTPTAGDNSTKIATTAFVNAKAENYLPLSGGTLTGDISIEPQMVIKKTNNSDGLTLCGGSNTGANAGAKLDLAGADNPEGGAFILQAGNENGYKQLKGHQDGTLTWDGKTIERVNSSGSDYIRYENGIQICWGDLSIPSGTAGREVKGTMTFPYPFKNDKYGLTFGNNWCTSSNEYYRAEGRFATNFTFTAVSVGSNDHMAFYVAVGWWK